MKQKGAEECLASTILELSQGTGQLSRSTGEAAQVTKSVASSILVVTHNAKDSGASANKIKDSSSVLNENARKLQNIVSKFKTAA